MNAAGRFWKPAAAILLLIGLFPSASWAHDATPRPVPLDYFAHRFDPEANFDPATREHRFPMNLKEPAEDERPDTDTDLRLAGDPEAIYVFTATEPIGEDTSLSQDVPGRFLFWIRAWQGDGPASPRAPGTRVSFTLQTTAGTLVAHGSLTQDVAGSQPIAYNVSFIPKVDRLGAGSILRWTVNITGTNPPGYVPVAAPYGVSRANPFTVRLVTEVVPPPVPAIRVVLPAGPLELAPHSSANITFTVSNEADEPDEVFLSLQGQPPTSSAEFRTADGRPVSALSIPGGSATTVVLNLLGLSPGSQHNLNLRVASLLGADDAYLIQVYVATSSPTKEDKKTPAIDVSLVSSALLLLAFLRRRMAQG